MAIKFYLVRCPACGANIPAEEGRASMFCTHCGSQVIVNNENEYQYTYRHIDDAQIKHAENERIIELKRLELYEKERKEEKRHAAIIMTLKIIVTVILGIISAICLLIVFAGEVIEFIFPLIICVLIITKIWHIKIDDD